MREGIRQNIDFKESNFDNGQIIHQETPQALKEKKHEPNTVEKNKLSERNITDSSNKMWHELEVLPKINSKNYKIITEQIINNLNIIDENDKQDIRAKIEIIVHISRGYEKVGTLDEEGKKITRSKLAIKDVEWRQKVSDRIISVKKNEYIEKEEKNKKIDNIWRDMEELYEKCNKYFEDLKNESGGYNIGSFDDEKKGILGPIAAEKMCEEMDKVAKKINLGSVEVAASTPKEDVEKQIDFFIKIKHSNGAEEIFPCQVKVRSFKKELEEFILENMVVVIGKEPDNQENLLESDNEKIRDLKRSMAKFRINALGNKFNKGIFIIVPHGYAIFANGENRQEFNLLKNDGETASQVKNIFVEQFGKYIFGVNNLNRRAIIKYSKKIK